jgi:PST family polysaccharide transporter/lipopolysaccharide exporter
MAYYLSNLPATQLTNTLGQVSFSAFSKVNSDLCQMRHIFRYTLNCLGYLTIPLSFGLYLLLPEFVTLVLGESWLPVIPVAQILVLWGACRSIGSITGPLFQAVNQPELISSIGLLQLAVMLTLIYPLIIKFGLLGVALAVVISGFIQVPVSLAFAQRITRLPWSQLIGSLGKPLIGAALMFFLLQVLITSYWAIDSILDMVLISCTGCVLYVFLMWLLQSSTLTLKKILPVS